MTSIASHVIWFEKLGRNDVARVGGKNASLGALISDLGKRGIEAPPGFATTTDAYWAFVDFNQFRETMAATLHRLKAGELELAEAGESIRQLFLHGKWPDETARSITASYAELCKRVGRPDVEVAVRSSATAEDLPHASFAGQHESFLNIRGERDLLQACRKCLASLFTDRAISYRATQGFDHMKVALSVGIQLMVRSDLGGAGVMFSVDTETGFDRIVVIDAAWGLGEMVVKGIVDPDEYQVFKPLLQNKAVTPIVQKKLG